MKQKLFTKNFVFLLLGQICSLTGNYTLKFALSMYVLERTGSASVFAGVLALSMVPLILCAPFGGVLADRADRRRIMVSLDAVSGAAVLAAGLFLSLGREILVISVLQMVLSVLAAFESPTVQACIPQLLSGDNLIKGNAAVSQVSSLVSLAAPFLGALFYTAFGIRPVFYGTAACFGLTAVLECFIRLEKREAGQQARRSVREDFSAGAAFLRREEPGILKLLLLAAAVSMFVAGAAVVGFPYLVRTVLGLSAGYYGAAESAMGAAAILGGLGAAVLARKLTPRWLSTVLTGVGACLIPCGLAFLLPLGVWARYSILLLMFCSCQMGCSFFSAYAVSLIQKRTPERLMGRVMSYMYTLSLCAQPVGQILYGTLLDRFSGSVYWVLIPSGLLVCLMGLLSFGRLSRFHLSDLPPSCIMDPRQKTEEVRDMNFSITDWLGKWQEAVEAQFSGRVWFLGIQGSFGRGEATERSDIDAVLILDRAEAADLEACSRLLDGLPERERVCGFISGREELLAWEPSDLFQFYQDTVPLKGTLEPLADRIRREDVWRAVHTGACNVYHMCAHNMVHEKDSGILKALYKSAVFTLQAVSFLRTGSYERKREELASRLEEEDRSILERGARIRDREELSREEFDVASGLLLQWASGWIRRFAGEEKEKEMGSCSTNAE